MPNTVALAEGTAQDVTEVPGDQHLAVCAVPRQNRHFWARQ